MAELAALPSSFAAGTTVVYRKNYSDYPASSGWTAALHIRGKETLDVAAAASGADFIYTISAAVSAPIDAGVYKWVERVTKAGEKYDVAEGVVEILLDLATAAAGAAQSYAERTLAVIEAALTGELTDNMRNYQIAGRAVALIEPLELEALRVKYLLEVAAERNPYSFGTDISARFVKASP